MQDPDVIRDQPGYNADSAMSVYMDQIRTNTGIHDSPANGVPPTGESLQGFLEPETRPQTFAAVQHANNVPPPAMHPSETVRVQMIDGKLTLIGPIDGDYDPQRVRQALLNHIAQHPQSEHVSQILDIAYRLGQKSLPFV